MSPARFATLSDPEVRIAVDVLCALETRRMSMHAADYQRMYRIVAQAMGSLRLQELLIVARQGQAVLAGVAENLLYDIGAETLVDEGRASRDALRQTAALMRRLRRAGPASRR